MNKGDRNLCRCINSVKVRINKEVVEIFAKGKEYEVVLYLDKCRIYGNEWTYHTDINTFEKHFKITKLHQRKKKNESM